KGVNRYYFTRLASQNRHLALPSGFIKANESNFDKPTTFCTSPMMSGLITRSSIPVKPFNHQHTSSSTTAHQSTSKTASKTTQNVTSQ
ncbi:AAEL007262-PA, partial [Aedes aegypti]